MSSTNIDTASRNGAAAGVPPDAAMRANLAGWSQAAADAGMVPASPGHDNGWGNPLPSVGDSAAPFSTQQHDPTGKGVQVACLEDACIGEAAVAALLRYGLPLAGAALGLSSRPHTAAPGGFAPPPAGRLRSQSRGGLREPSC